MSATRTKKGGDGSTKRCQRVENNAHPITEEVFMHLPSDDGLRAVDA